MSSLDCRSVLVLPASVDRCLHVIRPPRFQDGEYRLDDAVEDEKRSDSFMQAVSIRDDEHGLAIRPHATLAIDRVDEHLALGRR